MNTSRKLLLAGVAIVATTAAASSAPAQAAATTSATASATIFQPITVTKSTDLAFGRLIRPSTGNTTIYTVSEVDGTPGTSGGDGIFTSGGGTPGRAVFNVGGEGGQGFAITLGSPTVVNGGVTINLVRSANTGLLSGTIGTTGTATFGVGGNITLTDTSPTGIKSGSFNVTVAYN